MFVFAGLAVPASAEIVHLTSKRTLSVKSHRIDGNSITLVLRGGGEVTCDRSLIEKIVPDEVPYTEADEEDRPVGTTGVVSQKAMAPDLLRSTPFGEVIEAVTQAHGDGGKALRVLADRQQHVLERLPVGLVRPAVQRVVIQQASSPTDSTTIFQCSNPVRIVFGSLDDVFLAHDRGVHDFGENTAQGLCERADAFARAGRQAPRRAALAYIGQIGCRTGNKNLKENEL